MSAPLTQPELVFLSHANPQDNEFVSWLGTRLMAAGYTVWADIFRLVGGEAFWRDIGTAIKQDSAAVVVVLSRSSYQKDGVLDEIAMAVATARKLQKPEFVIPIRVDDLPYDEFPEQLVRSNAIDFSKNWAEGIMQLQDALAKAQVPKSERMETTALDALRSFKLRQSGAIAVASEQVASNWLPINQLPKTINFCRFGAGSKVVSETLAGFKTPIVPLDRLGLTFSDAATILLDEMPEISVEAAYQFDVAKFLSGERQTGPEVRARDASNMMVNLLRQAWENHLANKGMKPYQFANSTGWYVPLGLLDGNKATYTDISGKSRWKRLVGRSEKRNVYWHFAVAAFASLGDQPHFTLRPQIVFTTDGNTPLDSKARAATLRRSFCKNWWNDRWHGLLQAFVSFVAAGADTFEIALGGGESAQIGGHLIQFGSGLAIVDDTVANLEEGDADIETEADALDDGLDVHHDEEADEEGMAA